MRLACFPSSLTCSCELTTKVKTLTNFLFQATLHMKTPFDPSNDRIQVNRNDCGFSWVLNGKHSLNFIQGRYDAIGRETETQNKQQVKIQTHNNNKKMKSPQTELTEIIHLNLPQERQSEAMH